MNPPEGGIMQDENRKKFEDSLGCLCLAWINNRMFPILALMQLIHETDPSVLAQAQFFLTDIEHHFMRTDIPVPVGQAFRYLSCYLGVYPNVSIEDSRRAIAMIKRIYEALGIELNQHFEPRLAIREKLRRIINEKNAQKSSGRVYDQEITKNTGL